jgi:hypothetical protein
VSLPYWQSGCIAAAPARPQNVYRSARTVKREIRPIGMHVRNGFAPAEALVRLYPGAGAARVGTGARRIHVPLPWRGGCGDQRSRRRERCATVVSRHAFVSSAREGGRCEMPGPRRACAGGREAQLCCIRLTRAAGECEGAECSTTARAGGAFCWSRPAILRANQLRGEARKIHQAR